MSDNSARVNVQKFGRFLSAMVMPNIGAFIAWGFITMLFIPSGGSVSTTEVDATVVKQNGNVVANDSTVVHKTGDETINGIKTFGSFPILPSSNPITSY